MKKVFSTISSNCFYALGSGRFWAAVGVYTVILVLYTFQQYNPWAVGENGLPSFVAYPIVQYIPFIFDFGMREILIFICAIPAAGIFAEEWCSGRFVYSCTRSKMLGYTSSTVLSAFFISTIVSVFGMVLYIAIELPLGNPLTGDVNSISFIQLTEVVSNGGLLLHGHVFLFYFLIVLTYSIGVGVFSAGAVFISVIITNSYIAVVSSMVLYTVLAAIPSILNGPPLLNVFYVFSPSGYVRQEMQPELAENFSVISMLYPFFFAAVMLAIFITASYFLIKQKYSKKSDLA